MHTMAESIEHEPSGSAIKPADWLALRERLRGVLRASASADTPDLHILSKYVRE